jgi:hypothetical protein
MLLGMVRGPAPKRADQRRRVNKPAIPIDEAPATVEAEPFEVPEANPYWHAVATQWYDAVRVSGQSAFYVPSDWAMAWVVADQMSRDLDDTGLYRPSTVNLLLKTSASLLLTEGDRRRARIELARANQNGAGVAEPTPGAVVQNMDTWRGRLG